MYAIEFDSIVFKEGAAFVAYCPELDVSSCGADLEQARRNLKTAVHLFIEEAENMGTLSDILEESGFVFSESGSWQPPRIVATELMKLAA